MIIQNLPLSLLSSFPFCLSPSLFLSVYVVHVHVCEGVSMPVSKLPCTYMRMYVQARNCQWCPSQSPHFICLFACMFIGQDSSLNLSLMTLAGRTGPRAPGTQGTQTCAPTTDCFMWLLEIQTQALIVYSSHLTDLAFPQSLPPSQLFLQCGDQAKRSQKQFWAVRHCSYVWTRLQLWVSTARS